MRLTYFVGLCLLMLAASIAHGAGFTITVPGTACSVQNVSAVTIDVQGLVHYQGGSLFGPCLAGNNPPPPPPPPSKCVDGTPADLPGFVRRCEGSISWSMGAGSQGMQDFTQAFGQWPGSIGRFGTAFIIPLAKMEYVSFELIPTTSNTIKLTNNNTWGGGGWISIAKAPGTFKPISSPQAVCYQSFGGSNSIMLSTNNFGNACKLQIGVTYWVSLANAYTSGQPICTKATCNLAYTILKVN